MGSGCWLRQLSTVVDYCRRRRCPRSWAIRPAGRPMPDDRHRPDPAKWPAHDLAVFDLVFVDGDAWISASGTGAVVEDSAKKQELWNRFAEAWFQTDVTDPAVALLRVDLTGGEHWDWPHGPTETASAASCRPPQRVDDVGAAAPG